MTQAELAEEENGRPGNAAGQAIYGGSREWIVLQGEMSVESPKMGMENHKLFVNE
jgi:hypothetical protein